MLPPPLPRNPDRPLTPEEEAAQSERLDQDWLDRAIGRGPAPREERAPRNPRAPPPPDEREPAFEEGPEGL